MKYLRNSIQVLVMAASLCGPVAFAQSVELLYPTTQQHVPLHLGLTTQSVAVPVLDFSECVSKLSEACINANYPNCTEWSVSTCRQNLPATFPKCFASLAAACRNDGYPNCPEFALGQCSK